MEQITRLDLLQFVADYPQKCLAFQPDIYPDYYVAFLLLSPVCVAVSNGYLRWDKCMGGNVAKAAEVNSRFSGNVTRDMSVYWKTGKGTRKRL